MILSESSFRYDQALMATGAHIEPLPGAGYRAILLAHGRCSGIVQSQDDFRDVGPASLIVEEAGGKVTDFSGQTMYFDKPLEDGIILSNGICHAELLKIVRKH